MAKTMCNGIDVRSLVDLPDYSKIDIGIKANDLSEYSNVEEIRHMLLEQHNKHLKALEREGDTNG